MFTLGSFKVEVEQGQNSPYKLDRPKRQRDAKAKSKRYDKAKKRHYVSWCFWGATMKLEDHEIIILMSIVMVILMSVAGYLKDYTYVL